MSKTSLIIPNSAAIGQISAEADDEFLFQCFFDHPSYSEISDPKSSKMIILGSTGVGKTAIIRKLEQEKERCISIQLDELSLSYISNSDVINFLIAVDVPMDHFFQALWRHVICLEYIKIRFRVDNEQKSSKFWIRIRDYFKDAGPRQKALKYLEKWEKKFWIGFDESVKEITSSLEGEIYANFGSEVEKFRTDAGYVRKTSSEKKSQLQQRLRKFVDADLLSELSQVINLLAEYDERSVQTNYVLIDRLDENWVDDGVRVHLVRSLIESLKSMRRITDLKVVVALRSDLMERVIQETKERGFQSEKYDDYVLRIKWDAEQLKELVNKRINYLYRKKYTKENVHFDDVFIENVGPEKAIKYIIERTLHRPRDVITFVNMCLAESAGNPQVRRGNVRSAERMYSESRRNALIDEWRPIFPGAEPTLKLLEGRHEFLRFGELETTKTLENLMEYFCHDEKYRSDRIWSLIEAYFESGSDHQIHAVLSRVIERLYLMGVVGVNTSSTAPVQWFYKTQRSINSGVFDSQTKIRIHPMLHSSLSILS